MTRAELREYLGKNVTVVFKDGDTEQGILGFTPEFSEKYGFRRPNYFTINDTNFKVSHIRKITAEDSVPQI